MAAYHRVYYSRPLKADCQGPGSAPEPYEYGLPSPYMAACHLGGNLDYYYTASQKRISDIFSYNSSTNCLIFIIFGTYVDKSYPPPTNQQY